MAQRGRPRKQVPQASETSDIKETALKAVNNENVSSQHFIQGVAVQVLLGFIAANGKVHDDNVVQAVRIAKMLSAELAANPTKETRAKEKAGLSTQGRVLPLALQNLMGKGDEDEVGDAIDSEE